MSTPVPPSPPMMTPPFISEGKISTARARLTKSGSSPKSGWVISLSKVIRARSTTSC
jgi:hypothetical protein